MDEAFDLVDILAAIGEAGINARWVCSGVECFGEGAEAIHAFSDLGAWLDGGTLAAMAARVGQTVDGYFRAFQGDEATAWLVIRAVDGAGFDVECRDAAVLERLRGRFRYVTELPSVTTYPGVYITHASLAGEPPADKRSAAERMAGAAGGAEGKRTGGGKPASGARERKAARQAAEEMEWGRVKLAGSRAALEARLRAAGGGKKAQQGGETDQGEGWEGAVDEWIEVVQQNPQAAQGYVSLGVALRRSGDELSALASYDKALELDPKNAEALYFQANIYYSRGEMPEAIAGYTRAIGLQPGLIDAHREPPPEGRLTDFSRAPAEMYWIAKAARRILSCDQVLQSRPGDADAYFERGTAYYELWNYAAAAADFSLYLQSQPEDGAATFYRGLAYEQVGQYAQALADYSRAIVLDPEMAGAYYINRGITYGKMGNFDQALEDFNQAIQLRPKEPDGYYNRGALYFQMEDFDRAAADFACVLKLAPKDKMAKQGLAQAKQAVRRKRNLQSGGS